jgi:hypothetical protein
LFEELIDREKQAKLFVFKGFGFDFVHNYLVTGPGKGGHYQLSTFSLIDTIPTQDQQKGTM